MLIKIFGSGCAKCAETENVIRWAVEDSGCPVEIQKITNFREMMDHGVMSTPAISIDGRVVCIGAVPTKKEAWEWITGACRAGGCCLGGAC